MQCKIIFFLVQYLIIHNYHEFVEALVGRNVREALPGEFSNVVSIMMQPMSPRNLRLEVKCTGTMISRDHILTAEHCLDNVGENGIYILAGSIDTRNGVHHNVAWWITYNLWSYAEEKEMEYLDNDIAIIKLIRQVASNIIPAPISPFSRSDLDGLNITIAGWGKLDDGVNPYVLHTATTIIISNEHCEEHTERLLGYEFYVCITFFCSMSQPPVHVHTGDSGGPIFYNEYILGVNQGSCPSEIGELGDPRKVNLHFSVDYYRTFIDSLLTV